MSETLTTTTGKVAWFEVPAADTARARKFYSGLLGWQFQPFGDEDYHVAYEPGGAVSGVLKQDALLVYFGVEDVDAALARVRELGGEAGERQEIPDVGVYAVCADSEGNRFGLYQDGANG